MDSGSRQYTFFWSIENFSYWNRGAQNSPTFSVRELEGTSWYLQLNPTGCRGFSLSLCRSVDAGPRSISVHCELSVLGADGAPLSSAQRDQVFYRSIKYGRLGRTGYAQSEFLNIDEALLGRKANSFPKDMLTVCCKISLGKGNVVRNVGQCSARTRIKVEKFSFFQKVERFSTSPLVIGSQTIDIPPPPSMSGLFQSRPYIICCLNSTVSACSKEDMEVEIASCDSNRILRECELYLLDVAGNAIECGRANFQCHTEGNFTNKLPLSLTRSEVLSRKSEFLPNDQFSLLCKCTFTAGLEFETIDQIVQGMPLAAKQNLIDVPTGNACTVAEKISTYPSASDDMKALYLNQSFTDVQLKTKTKLFPAHKAVLCARSPVFNAMMSSNMKEKRTRSIEVDDLEDDVVQQLLLFLYSDSVEKLDRTMATRLYFAADKYQVEKLRQVCSSFLVENLTPADAGDLLLLADTHSDTDLKTLVEDFILKNQDEVFFSDEWERLTETNPVLVMKTMRQRCKKRRLE